MRSRALLVAVLGAVMMLPAAAASGSGPWVWPLAGARMVSRAFDPPATPYGPGHRGADLPGRVGQSVLAAGAGRISYAGLLAGRGVVVVVHGDLRTTYEPVLAVVRVGQVVTPGQVIGRLAAGHVGCPGACLHWGLLRGEVYLDPVRLVRAGPSRLLPVDTPLPAGTTTGPVTAGPVSVGSVVAPAQGPAQGPAQTPAPHPADPGLLLRSADAAWGGAAVVALIAGLLLLQRARRDPPAGPAAPAALAAEGLIDLTRERERRRMTIAS